MHTVKMIFEVYPPEAKKQVGYKGAFRATDPIHGIKYLNGAYRDSKAGRKEAERIFCARLGSKAVKFEWEVSL